ncbi:MAG TPA: M48 family metallopeptidase [Gemmatimonadaceae bacterium]|nr:M48 family metallopeptidase [Gemmatimonadaceae bacterium]
MQHRREAARFAALGVAVALGISACGVSQQQEVQLGQQESAQIQQQLPLVQDPLINQYVSSLGNQIASKTSRADLQWQFYVVNTDVVNAFALPGGIVYVNRGVLERADKMDELAGVLGHEIEHVVRRHSVKQMEQMQGANVGVALACTLTNICSNQAAATAINVGGTAIFAKFSRTDEVQADEGGFRNLIAAGINPEGMLSFFQKLLAEEQQSGSNSAVNSWFSDHPGTQDRIQDIQNMLAQVPASTLRNLTTDTQAFQQMKRRVMSLPPAPRQAASGQ